MKSHKALAEATDDTKTSTKITIAAAGTVAEMGGDSGTAPTTTCQADAGLSRAGVAKRMQRGLTLLELLIYLATLALVTVFIAEQRENIESGIEKEQAYFEILKLKEAAKVYAVVNGNYTGISMTSLVDGGYNVEPYTDGTNQNVYQLDITIASSSARQATITYEFPDEDKCGLAISRANIDDAFFGTPACTAGPPAVFTATIGTDAD